MKLYSLIPAFMATFICMSACPQQQETSLRDLAAQAPELIQMQSELEQMVPPGLSIEAREVSRKGTSGKDLEVRYNIYVKGVPLDTMLRQVQWPVGSENPIPGIGGITLNKDGLMICAGRTAEQCHSSKQLDAPVAFDMQTPLKGEPRRSVFMAPNLRIAISLVPDPVQSVDGKCSLSAIRLSPKFELAMIEGFGFRPDTDVHIRFSDDQSAGVTTFVDGKGITSANAATTNIAVRSDSSGAIQTAALANASKYPRGLETVEVTDPNCHPKITYEWGVF